MSKRKGKSKAVTADPRHPTQSPYASASLREQSRRMGRNLLLAFSRFTKIDGTHRAAAFSYYAFFALFPLIILIVTVASQFIDWNQASHQVIRFIERYIAVNGQMRDQIVNNIASVVYARGQASLIAFLMLVWVANSFFSAMISATNRAWGCADYSWWRLPLRSFFLLIITVGAVLAGTCVPMLAKMARKTFFPMLSRHLFYRISITTSSLIIVFLCLALFYKYAPRRKTQFREVWFAALLATLLLKLSESLFGIYLNQFATLNAVYGAAGGMMAMLLWIYLSGSVFIYGACLCSVSAEEVKIYSSPSS